MRIRKLAKLNATTTSQNSKPQAHVCHFNQSPWDVMTDFSPPSSPFHLPSPKVNGNGLSAMNESFDASISVMEWEKCDDDKIGQKFDFTDGDGGVVEEKSVGREGVILCCKTDGKNWQCKREAMYGNSMCEHHLSLLSKRNSNGSIDKKKKKPMDVVEMEDGKRRVRAKKAAAANPHEIYYYSGFGPGWGKKRGDEKEDNGCGNNLSINLEHERVTESSKFVNEGIDYIEDDDDDEEDNGLGQKKRARKPIKARSLKSLM